jgi:hypothetical protein
MLLQLQSNQSSAHSLYRKRRERERERERGEREREREREFGFLCADVGKELQYHQSRQIEKDEMRKHAICRTSANEDWAKKDSSRFQELTHFSQELCEIDWLQSTLSDVSSSAASIDGDREVEVLFTSQNTASSVLLSLTKTTKDLRLQQVYADIRKMPKRFVCLGVCIEE